MDSKNKPPRLKRSVQALLYTLVLTLISALLYSTLFTRVFSWSTPTSLAFSPAEALNGEPRTLYTTENTSSLSSEKKTAALFSEEQKAGASSLSDTGHEQTSTQLTADSSSAVAASSQAQPDSDGETEASQNTEDSSGTSSSDADALNPQGAASDSSKSASSASSEELSSVEISHEHAEATDLDLGYPITAASSDAPVKTILIDPGHGASDTGDAARDGTVEKNITLSMAKAIQKHLQIQNPNLNVVLLRENDTLDGVDSAKTWEDLVWRRKKIEEIQPDYFLSLHAHDDDGQSGGYGFILNPDDPVAAALCQAIETNLQNENWGASVSTLTTDQYPLQLVSLASSHSAQLNLGSPGNESDLKRLKDEDGLDHAAAGIAAAISSTIQDNAWTPGYISRAGLLEQKTASQS